jgi:protein TonB
MLRRYAGSLGVAALVTFGLSLLMQSLVWRGVGDVGERKRRPVLEYVRVKRESETEIRRRERPKEVVPENAAQPPKIKVSEVGPPMQRVARVTVPTFKPSLLDSGGLGVGSAIDTDVIPMVRVNPNYPPRAQARGVEGWVHLRFTVTPQGTTDDIEVVDSDPKGYFERAARRAVKRYRYKPRIENGVPVRRPGVELIIEFELEDEEAG